jgi:hypothetical protein
MDAKEITFDSLPQAVAYLVNGDYRLTLMLPAKL